MLESHISGDQLFLRSAHSVAASALAHNTMTESKWGAILGLKIEEGRGNKRRFRSLGEMETKEAKKKELQRRGRERKNGKREQYPDCEEGEKGRDSGVKKLRVLATTTSPHSEVH